MRYASRHIAHVATAVAQPSLRTTNVTGAVPGLARVALATKRWHRGTVLAVSLVASLGAARYAEAQDVPTVRQVRNPLDVSIAVKGSTLGAGLEVAKLIGGHVALRAGVHGASFGRAFGVGGSDDGIGAGASDIALSLRNATAVVDLFPFNRGAFRVSGGVVLGTNSLTFAEPSGEFSFDEDSDQSVTYTGELVETLTYARVRPYAGFGWGTPASRRRGIGFVADFGVAYGKPEYALAVSGPQANDPQLQADLAAERARRQADVDGYAFYPVLGLGLSYRF